MLNNGSGVNLPSFFIDSIPIVIAASPGTNGEPAERLAAKQQKVINDAMKIKSLTLLALTMIPLLSPAQPEIRAIDQSVQEIRTHLATFKKVEKTSSKEGTRIVYLKNKALKLVTVTALEPETEKNVEWYFADGQLAYCETNWVDTRTNSNVFNEKCYLHNGRLVSWTNSREETIDPSSDAFKKMETELAAYGRQIAENALK